MVGRSGHFVTGFLVASTLALFAPQATLAVPSSTSEVSQASTRESTALAESPNRIDPHMGLADGSAWATTLLNDWLTARSPWIYTAIFVVAVLEGFVLTTFAISGTIAFVALGGLLVHGYLNPLATLAAIYVGTVAGDGLTFFLSTRLQGLAVIARHQQRLAVYRAPLARDPFRFIVLGHLTPYLKGVSALLAGGVVPGRVWIRAEATGALCGTLFFTGMGAAGVLLWGNAKQFDAMSLTLGIILSALFLIGLVRGLRPCRLADVCQVRPSARLTSRNWKRLFFLLYFPLWHPVRWVEAALRKLPTRSVHPNLAMAFPDVRAGDVFLVRLHAPSPWGKWAHSAIAVDPDSFCHGFDKTITAHRFDAFPVRYIVAHLRVRCDDGTAALAAAAAAE